jgi:GWxTD domain-containing protein
MASPSNNWRRLISALIATTIAAACAGTPYGGSPPADNPAPKDSPPPAGAPTAAAAPAAKAPQPGVPPAGGEAFGPYRNAGLLVQTTPIPFVGSVRYFASPSPDSTLALVALSLANRSFLFTPNSGNGDRALYGVSIIVRDSAKLVSHVENEETILVASFKETMRGDESVVFQRFVMLPPGSHTLSVTVTDRSTGNSAAAQIPVTVPRLASGSLSTPAAIHRATARTRLDTLPDLVSNPRATLVFGRDSIASVYLEAYALPAGSRLVLTVENPDHAALLRDTVTLTREQALESAVIDLPMVPLGLGRRNVVVTMVGGRDTVQAPLWISVGEGMGIANFDELLSYLRYFATADRLQQLRDTPPAQRGAAWYAFWKESDPNPLTQENEALTDYFDRIQAANRQFKEQGEPGWLTDRGKVYITLGEPDQVMGQNGKGLTPSGRSQYWAYSRHGIRLEFVDQNGFGRWRLTQRSEADFDNIAAQERFH